MDSIINCQIAPSFLKIALITNQFKPWWKTLMKKITICWRDSPPYWMTKRLMRFTNCPSENWKLQSKSIVFERKLSRILAKRVLMPKLRSNFERCTTGSCQKSLIFYQSQPVYFKNLKQDSWSTILWSRTRNRRFHKSCLNEGYY